MSQLMARSVASKQCFPRFASLLNGNTIGMSSAATHPNPNPQGWKSWRDIPDSMIPTISKRDPNNKIYGTRAYINLRKQQIWMQIPDGVPVYLKNGIPDKALYYGSIVSVLGLMVTSFYFLGLMIFGSPKRK